MVRIIKQYDDGTQLFFQTGRIDDYKVTLQGTIPSGLSPSPEDSQLLALLTQFNPSSIWTEALNLSEQSKKLLDDFSSVFYTSDYTLEQYKIVDVYLACMIAEERKRGTRLGSKIKLLGLHQVLFEGYTPSEAANFSKGKKALELLKMCLERKF